METITMYTDGGCRGNGKDENIGAYAYIIERESGDFVEHFESFDSTTNNKMELLALIAGLESLTDPAIINAYSDSQYVCSAINNNWITNWQKNGWKTAKKEPVKNKELWLRLVKQLGKHNVRIKWVKGHAGNELNERCDELLNFAMDSHTWTPKPSKAINDDVSETVNKELSKDKVVGLTTEEDMIKNKAVLKRLIEMRDELNQLIEMMQ